MVLLGFMGVAWLVLLPIFRNPHAWGIQDWDQHLFYHAAAAAAVVEHGELPLWNPYACGGMVMLANPQSRMMTPFFLLHVLFGVDWAIRLEIVLHLGLMLAGVFVWARDRGTSSRGALAAAMAFGLSSMFAANVAVGMTWFLSVAFWPWLALFVARGVDHRRNLWGAAACVALMLGEGGAYPLVIVLTCLGVHAVGVGPAQAALRNVWHLVCVVALGLALGALKVLPMAEFLMRFPRHIQDASGFSLASLVFGLLAPDHRVTGSFFAPDQQAGFWQGMSFGVDENACYVGFLGLFLAGAGVATHARKHRAWLLVLCLMVWVSFGSRIWPSAWDALHALPVYGSMRVAQRFRLAWMLPLALFAGLGLDFMERAAAARWGASKGAALGWVLLVVLVVDITRVTVPIWEDAFSIPPRSGLVRQEVFRQVRGLAWYDAHGDVTQGHPSSSWSALYPAFLQNLGTVDCYETAEFRKAARAESSADYRGEAWVELGRGVVSVHARTMNMVRLDAEMQTEGVVVLNQNNWGGWLTSVGTITQQGGLVTIHLPPGTHHVTVRYRPPSVLWGAALSFLTLLVGLGTLFRRPRGHGGEKQSTVAGA